MTTTQIPRLPEPIHFDRPSAREALYAAKVGFAHEMPLDYWEQLMADRRNGNVRTTERPVDIQPARVPQAVREARTIAARPAVTADADVAAFLAAYTGSFEFLTKMAGIVRNGRALTPNQAAAVRKCMAREQAPKAPVAAPAAPQVQVTEGMWRTADGAIWKVLPGRTTGNLYAKRLGEGGSFEYVVGGIHRVRETGVRLTLDEAKQYGRVTGRCCVCARLLTDPASITAGIGPVCAARF